MNLKVSSQHQLIPNVSQYILHYKFVTINSDDRDIKKYPNSSEFELELPQDYINVQTVKLNSWSFPHKYDVFSDKLNNTMFIFSISPYYTVVSSIDVFQAPNNTFVIYIENGSYTPSQMGVELTNKMNESVTEYIKNINLDANTYDDFIVEYHEVSQKIWFGNKNSPFLLNNGSQTYFDSILSSNTDCLKRHHYSQYINWGLPYFLGFKKLYSLNDNNCYNNCEEICDNSSVPSMVATDSTKFYYKSSEPWLTNTIPAGIPHYIISDSKMNLDGPSHFYMEIFGMNNMDETMPFSAERIHCHTNETNGIVNSCFAKIPVPTNPYTDWFNTTTDSYMLYNPPAEKIRRLRVKIRYHNNMLVNFDNFEFSFTIQLGLFMFQNEKKYNVYVPETVSNLP